MSIQIKRNHFYKKQVIDIGINVNPLFADLAQGTSTTSTLGTSSKENIFVLATQVPDEPNYGESTLKSAALSLYTSAVDFSTSTNVPQILGYRLNSNINPKEGGYSLASGGDKVALYSVKPHNPVPYLSEEFEGDASGLGGVTRMAGSSLRIATEPYININDFKKIIEREKGSEFGAMWGAFKKQLDYYDVTGETKRGTFFISGTRAKVTFGNGITRNDRDSYFQVDLGRSNMILATGLTHKRWIQHKWSKSDFGYIKYNNYRTATASTEANPQANKGNTIFDDFMATTNLSNPFDTTVTDPMLTSIIELSSEKAINGGQSLRMFHNWGYSADNPQVQKLIGVSGNMNPQCARVSLYNIPMPDFGHDFAKTTVSAQDTTKVLGQNRAVIPEIRLPMNITSLGANVLISPKNYTVAGAYDPNRETETPWGNPLFFYGATGGALSTGAKASMSNYEQTFLRSIVVTFSNYKPKAEHNTVDKFLDYGLSNFYMGKTFDNMVGGYVITRFGIDGDTVSGSNNAYAFPLPVTKFSSLSSTTADWAYTLGLGGMARMTGVSDLSDPIGNVENSTVLSWGRTFTSSPDLDARVRYAELPMNAWFTSRIFTDIFQKNGTGSTTKRPYSAPVTVANNVGNASETNAYSRGVAMRVIFDTESANNQLVTMSGAAGTIINIDGTVVDADTRNLPFIDIPFPIGHSSSSADAVKLLPYSFDDNPELYPKHMTIWVQNYPWVSGGNATDYSWYSLTTGSDNVVNAEGAAKEVELYIDSVNLLNYTPDIQNLTASEEEGVALFDTQTITSPSHVRIDSGSARYRHGFVGSTPIDITADCLVNAAGAADQNEVTIKYPTEFDTGYLENAGVVTIAGTGISGDIDTIDGLHTFTMVNNPVGAARTEAITFTSTGTEDPPVNKADLAIYEAGQAIVFGFDEQSDLPITTDGRTAYLLWNDFNTSNWSGSSTDPLLPNKTALQQGTVSGAIYSQLESLEEFQGMGCSLYGSPSGTATSNYNNNISGARFGVDTDGSSLSTNTINLGSGANNPWLSFDAGRQKGFMYMNLSGTTLTTNWVKRENILTSARVIANSPSSRTNSFSSDDLSANQIMVNDASIFNYNNKNESYIIYLSGDGFDVTTSKKSGLFLDSTLPPINNVISFTEDINMADDGITPLMTEGNLYRLMVSPEKYYVSMLYGTPSTRIPRSYSNVCVISEVPSTGAAGLLAASGTTFNEVVYSYNNPSTATGGLAGLNTKPWSLVISPDNANVILDKDYGYGTYDEETFEGGALLRGPMILDEYNYFNIPNASELLAQEQLNIALYYDVNSFQEQSVTFYTDDYAGVAPANPSKTPIIYWEYLDMPPVLSNLRVSPSYDLLSTGTDLYELDDTNLNAVTFNWDEADAGDIWYRYLITDTGSIDDKYHNVTSWTPLNEAPPNNNLATAPVITQYSPWNGVSTTGNVTVGSDVRSVVEGQGGYAVQLFDTTNGKVKLLGDATTYKTLYDNGTEWTLVMHWTPSAADKDTLSHIASEGNSVASDPDGFNVHKNTSNLMEVQIGAITMTGSKYIVCDGSKPTSIIVTLDTAKHTTAKLYVDGILDATSTTSSTVSTGRYYFVIGGLYSASARGTTGFMEEVLIYNRALEVIESSSEYVYNTSYTLDGTNVGSGNDPLVNNARLFAADYHNFRGTSPTELGMTQSTSWRTTLI